MRVCDTNTLIQNLNIASKSIEEYSSVKEIEDSDIVKFVREIYGDNHELVSKQINRYLKLVTKFRDIYGDGSITIMRAPARINIIGEHIDYIKYFPTRVLPFGSREYDMLMAIRKRNDSLVRTATTVDGLESKEFYISEYSQSSDKYRENSWLKYLNNIGVPITSWDNYIKASAFYLQNLYPQRVLKGLDILIDSTIPIAGGASSSSAMVVLSSLGFRIANELEFDKNELADSSSKAEWYVGTRGGKMDQTTICFAEYSKALLISFDQFSIQTVPIPVKGYKWITFYIQPADKGSNVMCEYNERTIVSCFIIPVLLKNIFTESPQLGKIWKNLITAIKSGKVEEECENAKEIIELLPETMTLKDIREYFPDLYEEAKGLYPVLFEVCGDEYKLKIRDRARHHLGEIKRTLKAAQILSFAAETQDKKLESELMKEVGQMMYETHYSLRELYEISTEEIDKVVDIAKVNKAYGARVMGGGFGGNVLVLSEDDKVDELIEAVQERYYKPQNRDGFKENSILVSTPGEGVATFPSISKNRDSSRQKLIKLTNDWRNWERNEQRIMNIASDLLETDESNFQPVRPVKAIIVAAGKGQRAKKSGIETPKPLVKINGKPAIIHVLDTVFSVPNVTNPIAILSPENKNAISESLSNHYSVDFLIQKEAKGTGHAVYQAKEILKDFDGDVIVIWGAQPLVRPKTLRRTVMIHQAVENSAMTFPTTKHKHPYAPLIRDDENRIIDSRETHLEEAKTVDYGEDNIGMFCLRNNELFDGLDIAHSKAIDSNTGKYNTPKGELGFPNQMVRTLVSQGKMVLGLAMADWREAKGIKIASDIVLIEEYLSDFQKGVRVK